ncbi:MCM DNA helicase complex subunit [Polyrhizophydium stewartii]|uniref:DNA replication licensing factor MCM2 n=1 Tax=Polyrhizophydium stewartii TaxID=2732419 RepID=A0ABR4N0X3_9FUNG
MRPCAGGMRLTRLSSLVSATVSERGCDGVQADRKRARDEGSASQDVLPTSPLARSSSLPPFSEADVDEGIVDDPLDDELDEDDEGEDLFGDNLDNDYRENARLDNYELESVDEEEYDAMDRDARLVAEAKMRRRDREEARLAGQLPEAFLDEDEEEAGEPMRARRRRRDQFDMDVEMADGQVAPLDLEALQDVKGSLSEFVTMEAPRRAIRREFHSFLTSYLNEKGESVYGERIRAMCESEGQSLEVDYNHLKDRFATLAIFLSNAPTEVLKIFDSVAMEVVLSGFEDYDKIFSEIHVRITNLPIVETLRSLRQTHLNTLVCVKGVVTRRTGVFPQLKYVKYDCLKCGAVIGPYYQDSTSEIRVRVCPNCQGKNCFTVNSEETVYRNYQRMTLQEKPGDVPAGRLPRHREVILLWDLVDSARPGDMVQVTGVYRNNFDVSLNTQNGFPVFATVIEANHISKKEDEFSTSRLTEEEQRAIRALAREPNIRQRIIKSIAPSIYGHEDIKTAIALSLFGGVFKNPQGKHRLRGDINVLLMGDPGTAKSQFLKYAEKTANRAVYTTGQGASAVGLTAAVHKDVVTREWTLEGGALVMADKGVCLIDEFDKMNDQDRTSIHEAMEQQSISISKAGIVATLQARCAVIAAANPIFGKYNPQVTFAQNVELTEPILSRFDILCVVKDLADPVVDESLARFVVNSHMRSHPSAAGNGGGEASAAPAADADIIPQDLLRKYIVYARDHVRPRLDQVDVEKLQELYAELRSESMIGGAIPITVRYLESIIRMSEAFARMHLRDVVRQDDIDHAIAVTIRSFLAAQKFSVRRALAKTLDKYLRVEKDAFELLTHVLSGIQMEHLQMRALRGRGARGAAGGGASAAAAALGDGSRVEMDVHEFVLRAREHGIHNVEPYFESAQFRQSFRLEGGKIIARS